MAVVVPSPATSLVCIDTSRTTCAPMFSKRSLNSISDAILTPSRLMSGVPTGRSTIALSPFGPSVGSTAAASRATPRASALRAGFPCRSSLAMSSSFTARTIRECPSEKFRFPGWFSRLSSHLGSVAGRHAPRDEIHERRTVRTYLDLLVTGRGKTPAHRSVKLHVDPDPPQTFQVRLQPVRQDALTFPGREGQIAGLLGQTAR